MSDLTQEQIDALIERAGLAGIVDIFRSAIEVNTHVPHPAGGFWEADRALSALLALYGVERAREERRKIEEQARIILAEYDAFETPTPVSAGAKYAIERLLSS